MTDAPNQTDARPSLFRHVPSGLAADFVTRLPDEAPNRWVDPKCRYCKPSAPCVMHDRRPRTLAQNRVLFGPAFGYEPTAADREEAGL